MNFSTKQRAKLRSIASTRKTIAQVGKEGISDNLLKSLSEALDAHELIKIKLHPTSGMDAGGLALNIAGLLNADLVTVIGRKAVLYRRSFRMDVEHIIF